MKFTLSLWFNHLRFKFYFQVLDDIKTILKKKKKMVLLLFKQIYLLSAYFTNGLNHIYRKNLEYFKTCLKFFYHSTIARYLIHMSKVKNVYFYLIFSFIMVLNLYFACVTMCHFLVVSSRLQDKGRKWENVFLITKHS